MWMLGEFEAIHVVVRKWEAIGVIVWKVESHWYGC